VTAPPEGSFYSIFCEKIVFDQKLTSNQGDDISHPITKKYIASPTRRAVFTRFFVKKNGVWGD
jgi:hypothetical protein